MLRVQGDQISDLYGTHKSRYGLPSTCNWKGYKTPFRRSGHIFDVYAPNDLLISLWVHNLCAMYCYILPLIMLIF